MTIIGLPAKNALLIIEFAQILHDQSRDLIDTTLEAALLRPIIMTSLAFFLPGPVRRATGHWYRDDWRDDYGHVGCGVCTGVFVGVMKLVHERHMNF